MLSHGNARDLTGQKFHNLTALEPVGKNSGGMLWRCICDCGNEAVTTAHRLRKGRAKSCGCRKLRTGENHPRYKGGEKASVERSKQHKTRWHWEWRLKRFGLTVEDYEAMVERQGNQCAICSTAEPGGKGGDKWYVDHCHTSGRVRGLLCNKCNMAIGLLNDDTTILHSAIRYLDGTTNLSLDRRLSPSDGQTSGIED